MRHLIIAVGLIALSACEQPAASGSGEGGATGGATPTVSASSGKWDAENACSLLDKATVGAALGTEIVKVEPGPVTQRTDQTAGFSVCYYELADGQRLAFMARQSPEPDNTPEAIQRARKEMVETIGPIAEVTGVGKSAFWVPGLRQLVVFLGEDRYFNVTMPAKLGDKDPKTLALGLATRVE